MRVQHPKHKHITLDCYLEPGDGVTIDPAFGAGMGGKAAIITKVEYDPAYASGFKVKVLGYQNFIDSDWIIYGKP